MSTTTNYDVHPHPFVAPDTSSLQMKYSARTRNSKTTTCDIPSLWTRGIWLFAASSFNTDPVFRLAQPYAAVLMIENKQFRKITIREARDIARSIQDRAEARRREFAERESRELESLLMGA